MKHQAAELHSGGGTQCWKNQSRNVSFFIQVGSGDNCLLAMQKSPFPHTFLRLDGTFFPVIFQHRGNVDERWHWK